ncbi:hypothetical protein [Streptomyces sp. 1222.5]|uniref:hypothetical protein n=1 Tax=Streptomyces sp. 1222.5 TaxID=1881026 RepID=UPI003EBF8CBD
MAHGAAPHRGAAPCWATVGDWRDEYIAYGLVPAQGSGTGPDDIATCVYNHHWKVTGGGATTPWSDGPSNGMRFDSSKSLGSNFYDAGVIFDRVTPSFFYPALQTADDLSHQGGQGRSGRHLERPLAPPAPQLDQVRR